MPRKAHTLEQIIHKLRLLFDAGLVGNGRRYLVLYRIASEVLLLSYSRGARTFRSWGIIQRLT